MNIARKHHYVPRFFLRNFSIDSERQKINTVSKHGHKAVWAARSIATIGQEKDFYVSIVRNVPVSVEEKINANIENNISKSDTWNKISSNKSEQLDKSDRLVLYSLIRHLEARTPHYLDTKHELAQLSANDDSDIEFTLDEREFYKQYISNPSKLKQDFDEQASSLWWTERQFRGSMIAVCRSPIRLRSSSAPACAIPAPYHPAMYLPLPSMRPFQTILTVNPYTFVSLTLGDFDGHFSNEKVKEEIALGLNRYFVGQFAKFPKVRHLITERDGLVEDMTWAPYRLTENHEDKILFSRKI